MKKVFADTNVLLRLFEFSDAEQSSKATALFDRAAHGEVSLVVGPPVLFELSWVLRSGLGFPNSEVLDIIEALIAWQGLEILDKEIAVQAVSLARATEQGFADAYITVTAKLHKMQVATFNKKHFEKLGADMYEM